MYNVNYIYNLLNGEKEKKILAMNQIVQKKKKENTIMYQRLQKKKKNEFEVSSM